ncbi:MAG: SDR family NAD(P)-dependent oxidoreductase [Candidatus Sulfotelmatobacter sp.]
MRGNQLQGKTAVITGGASGIGRATALLFAREGAAVTIVDLNRAAGLEVEGEICASGGRAIFRRGRRDSCQRLPARGRAKRSGVRGHSCALQ